MRPVPNKFINLNSQCTFFPFHPKNFHHRCIIGRVKLIRDVSKVKKLCPILNEISVSQ